MEITNSAVLEKLAGYNSAYKNASLFPHIIIDNVWNDTFLRMVGEEFKEFNNWEGVKEFFGAIKKSHCSNLSIMPVATISLIRFCNSSVFIQILEKITGIKNLSFDPDLYGGGMHSTGPGGYLKMHVDFNWHDKLKMHRRINVLIYLNETWDSSWEGQLWLGSKNTLNQIIPKKKIEICFNRMVIFNTNKYSWHGHPTPLNCPQHIKRNSIALYYYTKENGKDETPPARTYTIYGK